MASASQVAEPVLPPRSEVGVAGWARENLFGSWYSGILTVVSAAAVVLAIWFGLRWTLMSANWDVVGIIGGRFIIGGYNTDQACPGNDCFWRPQAALLMVTALLGMLWVVAAGGVVKRVAIAAAAAAALSAFLPYSMERMGLDVRLLLLANVPALAIGWALARYTPLGTGRWVAVYGVVVFLLTIILLRGSSDISFAAGPLRLHIPMPDLLRPVPTLYWGGLTLNLLLAVAGIAMSLPLGIALALGRRSHLPVVKILCVIFIEVFRGVPLITILFMSQHLVPLAFPENFPRNSLFSAGVMITLFSSAYMAENIRGGLQSLHPGQAEAARALGLAGWQTTLFISLPQAVRNVIPTIVGQFISLFKDTSLVYIIGMVDIVEIGRTFILGNPEYRVSTKEVFIFISIVFWAFTYGMSYVSRQLERTLGVGER